MNDEYKAISWFDFLLLVFCSMILLYIGYTFSFLNMLLMIVPVPLILVGYKYGYSYLILGIGLVSLIGSSILNNGIVNAYMVMIVGVNACALCFFMKEQDYTYKILFLGTIICTVSVISFGILMKTVFELDIFEFFRQSLVMANSEGGRVFFAGSSDMTEEQIELMLDMIPFMIIYVSAIFMALNYYLARRFLVNQGFKPYRIQKIEKFRLPDNILAGTTIVLILVLLTQLFNMVNGDILGQNVVYVFICVFMFQGLAVIGHYLVGRNIQSPVKTFILIVVFLIFGPLVLGLIGWLDAILDFRKLKPSKRE